MQGVKFVDEVKRIPELGVNARVRHLEQLPPKFEKMISDMQDAKELAKLINELGSRDADANAIIRRYGSVLMKYRSLIPAKDGNEFFHKLPQHFMDIQKEQARFILSEDSDAVLAHITDGRYPSYFTLNHAGNADMLAAIDGGVYVCTYKNEFWTAESNLYVFGTRNENFKEYLFQVRKAAEEKEGKDFFKGLPLLATQDQIVDYIKSSEGKAFISFGEAKDEAAMGKIGGSHIFMPNSPVGLTRINGKVKDQDLGALMLACFMDGVEKNENETIKTENGKTITISGFGTRANTFKGTYCGKDNAEVLSVLYSGHPYAGLGEWGGRIELKANEISPEVYKEFDFRFGQLAELVVDLANRTVTFFNVR